MVAFVIPSDFNWTNACMRSPRKHFISIFNLKSFPVALKSKTRWRLHDWPPPLLFPRYIVTLVLYFRNSIKFNLLLFRLFLDIIYADNSWDLLVRGTHMCIVSVSLLPCVYVFCAVLCFLHGVLTNDVLQISLNAAKMVLVMKRQIQHVVALFSPFVTSNNNVTIIHTFELSSDATLIPYWLYYTCVKFATIWWLWRRRHKYYIQFALVIACTCSDWLHLIVSCFMCEFWVFNFIVFDMNPKFSCWKWGALLQSLQNNDDCVARRSHLRAFDFWRTPFIFLFIEHARWRHRRTTYTRIWLIPYVWISNWIEDIPNAK